ncbi:hypothetical protein DPM12_03860 [Phytoactinopolyspora halophila]|uniref:Ribbon-helix-helix protein CopG domain-containing protein n=2 Tax=Phytoactinopolyspora halophila TaxID=1981511 RepID=A0A329R028_9ACTN|nr:hypothetical protein DPM12_03860 [Phytoactinopolyspora halophila]
MTITIDPQTLQYVDADARADSLSRSEYVERVLRHEHYRRLLAQAMPPRMDRDEERSLRDLLSWQDEAAS